MNLMLHAMTIVAALLFIGVSATMNALFLSSLGRSRWRWDYWRRSVLPATSAKRCCRC